MSFYARRKGLFNSDTASGLMMSPPQAPLMLLRPLYGLSLTPALDTALGACGAGHGLAETGGQLGGGFSTSHPQNASSVFPSLNYPLLLTSLKWIVCR